MKIAQLDDQVILLTPETYPRIPAWRLAARQGKVRCPVCGSHLRLMAGISAEPRFLHPADSDCACKGSDEAVHERLAASPSWRPLSQLRPIRSA
ncbi:hypothetical protein [Brevibacillus sedimenti]|uniref:hypothetical protein n=1 Tax=Brevibacillus sedimenti TaxID=2613334 RepID=UPI001E53B4F5|nr:hypothetical protein [Anoxybacillus sediminis]UFJ61309.1 hypothetical protein IRT44_19175 [Anoxybacillus sediminis]